MDALDAKAMALAAEGTSLEDAEQHQWETLQEELTNIEASDAYRS